MKRSGWNPASESIGEEGSSVGEEKEVAEEEEVRLEVSAPEEMTSGRVLVPTRPKPVGCAAPPAEVGVGAVMTVPMLRDFL